MKCIDYYYGTMAYVSHVLGHEGENSLLSALIAKDLATEISSGYDHMLHAFTYFDISITLTDKGFDHYEDVIEIVWARIHEFKKSEPQEYIFKEYSENTRILWQFYEKNDASSFVTTISEKMRIYDEGNMSDILSSDYLFKGFNPEGIKKVLEGLDPYNMNINFYSQSHGKRLTDESSESESGSETEESDDYGIEYQKEPWYGGKYIKEKISPGLLEKMLRPKIPEDIKMGDPPENHMFPSDLSVMPELDSDPKIPLMIHNDENMEIWHQK